MPKKQDFEYASSPEYNNLWIWQGSGYANITQRSVYARIWFE